MLEALVEATMAASNSVVTDSVLRFNDMWLQVELLLIIQRVLCEVEYK